LEFGNTLIRKAKLNKINRGKNICYVRVLYSTLLHLPTLRFHCVGRCRDRTEDCCDFGSDALTIRLDLIYSARSHPPRLDLIHPDLMHIGEISSTTRLDLIYWATSHPLGVISCTRLDLIHSARSHPPLGKISSTTPLDLIDSARSHPQLG
jgi:hypothetical protein